jgi:hypothetical protein
MDADRGVVYGGQQGRETRTTGVVAIFVPPSIFQEMQRFDPPMATNVTEEVICRDVGGIETGDEVANIVREDLAVAAAHLAIDANCNLAIRELERLAQIIGVL